MIVKHDLKKSENILHTQGRTGDQFWSRAGRATNYCGEKTGRATKKIFGGRARPKYGGGGYEKTYDLKNEFKIIILIMTCYKNDF